MYNEKNDPHQMNNLAGNVDFFATQKKLRDRLFARLKKTGDPRALGQDASWDYYPYYGYRRNKDWKVDPKPVIAPE